MPTPRLIRKGEKSDTFTTWLASSMKAAPEGVRMKSKFKNPPGYVPFEIDLNRLSHVAIALANRDISDCKIQDVDHVCKLLAHLVTIEQASPGFVNELCTFAPVWAKIYAKRQAEAKYQSMFDKAGLGEDFRAVVKAGNSPHQKDYMAGMVALQMKLADCNQTQAIKMLAEQSGRDEDWEDSLRRTVTRSKARKK